MKWTELALSGVKPLEFGGKQIATLERRATADRIDGLTARFNGGADLELGAAVDVSERLVCFPSLAAGVAGRAAGADGCGAQGDRVALPGKNLNKDGWPASLPPAINET